MTQETKAGADLAQIPVTFLTAHEHKVTSDSMNGSHDGVTTIFVLTLLYRTCHELNLVVLNICFLTASAHLH